MSQEWGVVKRVGSVEEAALVAGYLRSQGVPAEPDSRHVHPELSLGHMGEVRILVPLRRLVEARDLLGAPGWRPEERMEAEGESSRRAERPSLDRFSSAFSIEPR